MKKALVISFLLTQVALASSNPAPASEPSESLHKSLANLPIVTQWQDSRVSPREKSIPVEPEQTVLLFSLTKHFKDFPPLSHAPRQDCSALFEMTIVQELSTHFIQRTLYLSGKTWVIDRRIN